KIFGPGVGTGGVEVDVRTKVRYHEGFPQISRAEMGDYKVHTGKAGGYFVKVDRIRIPHVERRRQRKFLPETEAENTAVNGEHGPRYAVPVQFASPSVGECFGGGGFLPAQKGRHELVVLLLRECAEKRRREKMYVCISDFKRSPRRFGGDHSAPRSLVACSSW